MPDTFSTELALVWHMKHAFYQACYWLIWKLNVEEMPVYRNDNFLLLSMEKKVLAFRKQTNIQTLIK